MGLPDLRCSNDKCSVDSAGKCIFCGHYPGLERPDRVSFYGESMKIYSVEYFDYDEHSIKGLYSSKKKAKQALEKIEQKKERYKHEVVTYMVNNPEWCDENE